MWCVSLSCRVCGAQLESSLDVLSSDDREAQLAQGGVWQLCREPAIRLPLWVLKELRAALGVSLAVLRQRLDRADGVLLEGLDAEVWAVEDRISAGELLWSQRRSERGSEPGDALVTTIDVLVVEAREHGNTAPEAPLRRRGVGANRLQGVATEPPEAASAAHDPGDG